MHVNASLEGTVDDLSAKNRHWIKKLQELVIMLNGKNMTLNKTIAEFNLMKTDTLHRISALTCANTYLKNKIELFDKATEELQTKLTQSICDVSTKSNSIDELTAQNIQLQWQIDDYAEEIEEYEKNIKADKTNALNNDLDTKGKINISNSTDLCIDLNALDDTDKLIALDSDTDSACSVASKVSKKSIDTVDSIEIGDEICTICRIRKKNVFYEGCKHQVCMICAEQISQRFGKCPFDNNQYKSVRCVTCERPFEYITGSDNILPYEHDYDFSDGISEEGDNLDDSEDEEPIQAPQISSRSSSLSQNSNSYTGSSSYYNMPSSSNNTFTSTRYNSQTARNLQSSSSLSSSSTSNAAPAASTRSSVQTDFLFDDDEDFELAESPVPPRRARRQAPVSTHVSSDEYINNYFTPSSGTAPTSSTNRTVSTSSSSYVPSPIPPYAPNIRNTHSRTSSRTRTAPVPAPNRTTTANTPSRTTTANTPSRTTTAPNRTAPTPNRTTTTNAPSRTVNASNGTVPVPSRTAPVPSRTAQVHSQPNTSSTYASVPVRTTNRPVQPNTLMRSARSGSINTVTNNTNSTNSSNSANNTNSTDSSHSSNRIYD